MLYIDIYIYTFDRSHSFIEKYVSSCCFQYKFVFWFKFYNELSFKMPCASLTNLISTDWSTSYTTKTSLRVVFDLFSYNRKEWHKLPHGSPDLTNLDFFFLWLLWVKVKNVFEKKWRLRKPCVKPLSGCSLLKNQFYV